MQRSQFLQEVKRMRARGKSIRAIAAELSVDRGRVERTLRTLAQPSIAPIRPPAAGRFTSVEFVGRQGEMDLLKAALNDAICGQGQIVMLAGESGIGKTRTAQELGDFAESRGTQVLWGWCLEDTGAPPYWPWIQAIRSYINIIDSAQLGLVLGPGAADIAEFVPELKAKLPNLEPPPALELEQARFRLFDSITLFLKNAGGSQPLMLVLDDLHWADKPSLMLLQFVAGHLAGTRLLVVGCYRNMELSRQHPLFETLAQLSQAPSFQREFLWGLMREDVDQFIQRASGISPPDDLVETIFNHTEGNPFFMAEVVRLLSGQGILEQSHNWGPQGIRIPEGVKEVIWQRSRRLSDLCNQILVTASVIGREFDFKLLAMVCQGSTENQLRASLDAALEASLIEELPGHLERYRFSHALVQQALAEGLSINRRVRLHAHIGEALEDLYNGDSEVHAAELAYHFAEAEMVLGPDKLARYSRMAGEQALAAYAWEDALQHFQKAWIPGKDSRLTPIQLPSGLDWAGHRWLHSPHTNRKRQ